MDSKKIDDELKKSRQEYDVLKRKALPAELEVERANERVEEAKKVLQKLEADAVKKEAEYTKIQAGVAEYHTEVETLERQLKAEAEKLKRAA